MIQHVILETNDYKSSVPELGKLYIVAPSDADIIILREVDIKKVVQKWIDGK